MTATLTLAREIAYDAFSQVMNDRITPEEALGKLYKTHEKSLKRLDRNFIKEILYGSLRWYSKIQWILQNTATRDLKQTHAAVQAALVLGTYQIFYMDRVPDRAAVNESVEYVRKKGQAHAVPFVNGILRQIARKAAYFPKPDKTTKPVDYLSLQYAHPKWMVERWFEHFKFERMQDMLSGNNKPPAIAVRINAIKHRLAESAELQASFLREERTHSDRRPLRSCLHLKESPNLEEGSLFARGFHTIQGEASQLVGVLVDPKEGQWIVDACSGKGGKLGHMIELSEAKARFTAIEPQASQIQLAKESLVRLGHPEPEWVMSDFREWRSEEKPDKILIDAPCSGLGVLRRHPEGKWHKTQDLITKMAKLQRELIEHALTQLKKGGELIYSVCSFEPEETVNHVRRLKNEYGDKIELLSPITRLPDYYKKYVTRDNVLLIYSGNQDEMDGFGAFVIRIFEPLA